MSYGYTAPCPGDDLPYVSRKEETARNLAQIREQQIREAEALASRAAAAGRLPHEQANEEWAEAQAPLVAKAKAKEARKEAKEKRSPSTQSQGGIGENLDGYVRELTFGKHICVYQHI